MDRLPDYVDDVFVAEALGIPIWELYQAPYVLVEQVKAVMEARSRVRNAAKQ